MKRALVVCAVLAVLGFSAFGIGTFSGKWETSLVLLPDPELSSTTLTLNYTDLGFTVTSVSAFDNTGFKTQDFTITGALGPLSITGGMSFDAKGIAYKSASLKASLDFAGISGYLEVKHWAYGYLDSWPCTQTQSYMLYTLYASVAPISVTANFDDCCTGIAFKELTVDLKGLSLCCGVTYDVTFKFLKTGFDSLVFTLKNFAAICCGISFDASITFKTDQKIVSITPKFEGFGDACFKVFADIPDDYEYLPALEIYGWAITCTLGDCNYLEWVHAINDTYLTEAGYTFVGDSNEYFKLGFCGPGCCGGQWKADLAVYFQSDVEDVGLFGIVALGFNIEIPIMSNLTVTANFSTPDPELTIGWVFTF
ncbi:hypothetical protein H5T52_11480 [Candidatus Bipolaricaulota bacterium]|nr:hypothetical protein [Candidatus Bipolaricaulota bacterium]